jgi:hypothetical protein
MQIYHIFCFQHTLYSPVIIFYASTKNNKAKTTVMKILQVAKTIFTILLMSILNVLKRE